MADRRGRDADFTGASPESAASPPTASPPTASPVSPDRHVRTTSQPEHAVAAYVVNPRSPADAPGLGIQQDASSSPSAASPATARRLRVRIVSNTSPTGPAAAGLKSLSNEEGTYSSANTYYDPAASSYGLDGEDEAPRRYRGTPTFQSTSDQSHAAAVGLARSVGAESMRSTQSRRSKYDSEWSKCVDECC
jgi:hypothetical protein